jgi:hypothetical protein
MLVVFKNVRDERGCQGSRGSVTQATQSQRSQVSRCASAQSERWVEQLEPALDPGSCRPGERLFSALLPTEPRKSQGLPNGRRVAETPLRRLNHRGRQRPEVDHDDLRTSATGRVGALPTELTAQSGPFPGLLTDYALPTFEECAIRGDSSRLDEQDSLRADETYLRGPKRSLAPVDRGTRHLPPVVHPHGHEPEVGSSSW